MRSLVALKTVIVLSLSTLCFGQEQLTRTEIVDIVEQLVLQQRTTWLETGTVEVRHTEYRAPILTNPADIQAKITEAVADFERNPDRIVKTKELQDQTREAIPFNTRYRYANETETVTYELVKVDRSRYCQDITIESRKESVSRPASLAANQMTDDVELYGNHRRVFAWDGQNYTLYNRPINVAMVDASNRFPQASIGALKAGLIPWGKGMFSRANLLDAQMSGATGKDGELALTFVWNAGTELEVTLNPKLSLAPLSYSIARSDGTVESGHLSDYRQVDESWIPTQIITERYDSRTQRTLGFDIWDVLDISTQAPRQSEFRADYEAKASISHYAPVSDRPLRYYYNARVNTDELLARRLNAQDILNNSASQNCATLCLAYAVEKLGRSVSNEQLISVVDAGLTNLQQLQALAQSLGLNAEVVQTDVTGLSRYAGAQVILHFPGKNHFVILDQMDGGDVWCFDPLSYRFYYPMNINQFTATWSGGIALILSNDPISVSESDTVLSGITASTITGGMIGTCTEVKQEEDFQNCIKPGCLGWFRYFFEIMGCEPAPQGTCFEDTRYVSQWSTPCTENLEGVCVATVWYYSYMYGCP